MSHSSPSFGHRRNTPTTAAAARIYNYLIGGEYNYDIDRRVAKKLLEAFPMTGLLARHNFAWLHRLVRFAVAEAGLDQILDIGAGIPTDDFVHHVAQNLNPNCHIVYADYEEIAVQKGRELLAGNPNAHYIQADVRGPEHILDNPVTQGTLDFSRPVLLIFAALFHFVPASTDVASLVARYRSHLAPGSLIAVSYLSDELLNEKEAAGMHRGAEHYNRTVPEGLVLRSAAQLVEILAGTELTEDGVVPVTDWHADPDFVPDPADAGRRGFLCAVGRVP